MNMRQISRVNIYNAAVRKLEELTRATLDRREVKSPFWKYTQWVLNRRLKITDGHIYEEHVSDDQRTEREI